MSTPTSLPFALGKTHFDGQTVDTAVDAQLGWLGQTYQVESPYKVRSVMVVRAVKNASGIAMVPGAPVVLSADKTTIVKHAHAIGDRFAVVDSTLKAAGCPANDYCFVVEEGYTKYVTPATVAVAIAVGDRLVTDIYANGTTLANRGLKTRGTPANATEAMQLADGSCATAAEAVATTGEANTLKLCYVSNRF